MTFDLNNLNKIEVASLLGRDTKSVDLYTKEDNDPLPWHPTGKIKYYIWSEVLDWWIRRHTKKYTQYAPKDDLTAAKLEGQNLSNEKDSLEIAKRKGELVEASDVKSTWSNALVDIKQSLLNVGHTCSIDIIDTMTYATKKRIIDDAIFASLNKVIEDVKDNEDNAENVDSEPDRIDTDATS